MKRDIYRDLQAWRVSEHRKPLIVRGARQTGKTYILRQFGEREYGGCHYFNLEEDARLGSLFTSNLNPDRIIRDLSLYGKRDIRRGEDLIIFDEIQACNDALNALKYFNEQENDYHIASAGSLLGVRMSQPKSFPVGKVDFLDLYPMSFYEFLDAVGQERYRAYLENIDEIVPIPEAFHNELTRLLRRYYLVGGMPEAVARHAEEPDGRGYRRIQKAILDSYTLDFAKHAPASDIPKLSMVWESLPAQLARENNKFLFSVIKEGARAREYENALTWLANAGLIHRSTLVTSPQVPLKAYLESSSFKIFACDVGLLGALADLPVDAVENDLSILTEFHGAFVENYTAQQLVAMMGAGLYYWKNVGRASEVDFLLQHGSIILPLEAKAGVNVRSKSLAFYSSRYQPPVAIRTSLRNLKMDRDKLNVPLYVLQCLPRLLDIALGGKGVTHEK
ncbi:MAG: ATP-binding protein [Verrucomicrobia bacterium]|nr:ATP-binding protein [Verrucomicrobiota bacterium]MDA1088389.1 ATP-binding protein [Verrucomicrobiota bacterium]